MTTADLCARNILNARSKDENFQLLQLIAETAKEIEYHTDDNNVRHIVYEFNDESRIKLNIEGNLIASFVILQS